MDGYLLDTNILTYLFNESHVFHTITMRSFYDLPPAAPVYVSAITLGEIEYGHRCEHDTDSEIQCRFNAFIQERFPHVVDVRSSTRQTYGNMRAKLFHCYAPGGRKRKRVRPEELVDPTTAKELGIQENDLWLVAQAVERNLVFVTNDRISRIQEVAGVELRIVNWTTL